MKEEFRKITIPDAFRDGAAKGLVDDDRGDAGATDVLVCGPCDGVLVTHVELRDEGVRRAYTPDEARAIGRALIAAADHVQPEVK